MLILLLLTLLILRYVRKPWMLGLAMSILIGANSTFLYMRYSDTFSLVGLAMTTLLSLVIAFLMTRIPIPLERLRVHKG